jgi:hypothetical protein
VADALSARDDERGPIETSPTTRMLMFSETDGRKTSDAFLLALILLACTGRYIPNSSNSGVESHSLPV